MKPNKHIFLLITFFTWSYNFGQNEIADSTKKQTIVKQLSIEPAIGINTNYGTDLLLSTLVHWNPYKHLAVASYSSFNINNPFQRNFNEIKTDYNYSINQKIGIGYTFYGQKSSHNFLFMGGVKHTEFKESIVDPELDNISVSISTFSPDYGLMYSYKKGLKKCFFTFRTYVPLNPWPIKGSDINYIDGNLNNIALEFGVGLRIK